MSGGVSGALPKRGNWASDEQVIRDTIKQKADPKSKKKDKQVRLGSQDGKVTIYTKKGGLGIKGGDAKLQRHNNITNLKDHLIKKFGPTHQEAIEKVFNKKEHKGDFSIKVRNQQTNKNEKQVFFGYTSAPSYKELQAAISEGDQIALEQLEDKLHTVRGRAMQSASGLTSNEVEVLNQRIKDAEDAHRKGDVTTMRELLDARVDKLLDKAERKVSFQRQQVQQQKQLERQMFNQTTQAKNSLHSRIQFMRKQGIQVSSKYDRALSNVQAHIDNKNYKLASDMCNHLNKGLDRVAQQAQKSYQSQVRSNFNSPQPQQYGYSNNQWSNQNVMMRTSPNSYGTVMSHVMSNNPVSPDSSQLMNTPISVETKTNMINRIFMSGADMGGIQIDQLDSLNEFQGRQIDLKLQSGNVDDAMKMLDACLRSKQTGKPQITTNVNKQQLNTEQKRANIKQILAQNPEKYDFKKTDLVLLNKAVDLLNPSGVDKMLNRMDKTEWVAKSLKSGIKRVLNQAYDLKGTYEYFDKNVSQVDNSAGYGIPNGCVNCYVNSAVMFIEPMVKDLISNCQQKAAQQPPVIGKNDTQQQIQAKKVMQEEIQDANKLLDFLIETYVDPNVASHQNFNKYQPINENHIHSQLGSEMTLDEANAFRAKLFDAIGYTDHVNGMANDQDDVNLILMPLLSKAGMGTSIDTITMVSRNNVAQDRVIVKNAKSPLQAVTLPQNAGNQLVTMDQLVKKSFAQESYKDNQPMPKHFNDLPGDSAKDQLVVKNAPQRMVFNLNRFAGGVKSTTPVDVLSNINVPVNDNANAEDNDNNKSETEMHPTSIVCHNGSSVSKGHYVTFKRDDNGDWYFHDDGNPPVKIDFENDKKAQAFVQHNAYMVGYEKVDD